MRNFLINTIGFNGTLIHGDLLVLDRWKWLYKNLKGNKVKNLLDVGSGSGAFSIGASLKLNCHSLGLSWDEKNKRLSEERAKIIGVDNKVNFQICDVRYLDKKKELYSKFDTVICTENIEHIINDKKLIIDIERTLKIGGKLLLTTPNINYIPMGIGDSKQKLSKIEDGGHVRVGYSINDCYNICKGTRLEIQKIEFCSGFFSQKITFLLRVLKKIITYYPAWIILLPLRILPLIFDNLISKIFKWPGYSICFIAKKL